MNAILNKTRLALALSAVIGLSACGGGGGGGGTDTSGGGGSTPTNNAPTISGSPLASINEGQSYTDTSISASDSDSGDTLTFSIKNNPSWLAIDSATGDLSGTPSYSDAGDYTDITVSVSDGTTSTSLTAFSINVGDVFSLNGSTALNASADQAFSFTPGSIGGVSGDSYSASNLPAWLSIDSATGKISGTPSNSDAGSTEITISADNGFTIATHTITITVTATSTNSDFEISGKVIDGYISGANVFVDFNNNLVHDDNEPSAISSFVPGFEGSFTINVAAADVDKLSRANLVAELGTGEGINAYDTDRNARFEDLPNELNRSIVLMSQVMNNLDLESGEGTVFITPFTHLVQQEVLNSAGDNLAALNDSVLSVILSNAIAAVETDEGVNIVLATSDYFADSVDNSTKQEIADKAFAIVEYIQTHTNDSDNDGYFDFEDQLPLDANYHLDMDGDGIADEVDTDVDGDGLANLDDPNPTVFNQFENYAPLKNSNSSIGNCVADKVNDDIVCLEQGSWTKKASYAGKAFDFSADTVFASTNDSTSRSSCLITNNKVYCLTGTVGEEFTTKFGVDLPAFAQNPRDIKGSYSTICYLDDLGLNCFDGKDGDDDVIITDIPDDLGYIDDFAMTSDAICTISEGDITCWGSNSYNLIEDINASEFNQPKAFYHDLATVCVEDADGLRCWGPGERLLNEINHQSTSIIDVSFRGSNVCVTDDNGAHCYGYSPETNENNFYRPKVSGDVYDPVSAEVLLDIDFAVDENQNVIPVELNATSTTPALFNEETDTRILVQPLIDVPDLIAPTQVAHQGVFACFVDSDESGQFVECNMPSRCKVELASQSTLVENAELFPEDAHIWNCQTTSATMAIDAQHNINELQTNGQLTCAFTVAAAYCEAADGSFVGNVVLPQ